MKMKAQAISRMSVTLPKCYNYGIIYSVKNDIKWKVRIIFYRIFNSSGKKAYDFPHNIYFSFHQPHFEYPSDLHHLCTSANSSERRRESKRKINTSIKCSIIINGAAILSVWQEEMLYHRERKRNAGVRFLCVVTNWDSDESMGNFRSHNSKKICSNGT